MENFAYEMENRRDEMIGGKIVAMSPRPLVNHNLVAEKIYIIFGNYLKGKPCKALSNGYDLYLSPTDRFVPDGMIVCNKDIIKANGIHGTPDLVIEVLSPGTAKHDKGYKKDAYERAGVKEYWIADPANKSVEVYLLKEGRFVLDFVYEIFPDYTIETMTEEEKASIITKFQCSLFSDLTISIEEIFEGLMEF